MDISLLVWGTYLKISFFNIKIDLSAFFKAAAIYLQLVVSFLSVLIE